jgi:hypothetical protein
MATDEEVGFAHLDEEEEARLRTSHPDFAEGESVLAISAPQALVPAIRELVKAIAWEARHRKELVDVFTEQFSSRVLREPGVVQTNRLAQARESYFDSHALLTSPEVATLGGSSARNTSALASRWKAEGKIFAVTVGRIDYFPAFQFGDDGRPRPAVEEMIRVFGGEDPWTIALWFEAGSGWLGGRSPEDMLSSDPDAVVDAARRTMAPLEV